MLKFSIIIAWRQKSRCVCETLRYALGGNKVQKAMFSFKVKVNVTRSLTLVSFERVSLVEYACQYEVAISYGSKVIAKVKVDNRQTDKQTDRQTNRQTNKQTDRTKTICPRSFDPGLKNKRYDSVLWQKPLQPQKNPKRSVTTQKCHQKLRLHNDCGPT